jgi:photosystem I P700 chlorophyll a apoprotein A1
MVGYVISMGTIITSYSIMSALSAYGLIFVTLFGHSVLCSYSVVGYWQELIESIVWAQQVKSAPAIQPRALSITQGRAVGVAHYLLGGIATTWAFFEARIISVG